MRETDTKVELTAEELEKLSSDNEGGPAAKMAGWLGDSWPAGFLMLVATALSLWCLVEMLCLQGTTGPNRFGPDPLARNPVDRSPLPAPDWDQIRALKFARGAGPPPGAHVKRGHD